MTEGLVEWYKWICDVGTSDPQLTCFFTHGYKVLPHCLPSVDWHLEFRQNDVL